MVIKVNMDKLEHFKVKGWHECTGISLGKIGF